MLSLPSATSSLFWGCAGAVLWESGSSASPMLPLSPLAPITSGVLRKIESCLHSLQEPSVLQYHARVCPTWRVYLLGFCETPGLHYFIVLSHYCSNQHVIGEESIHYCDLWNQFGLDIV